MSSRADSHVNRSQSPEKEPAKTMKEICGLPLAMLSKSLNHLTHSWKMCQDLFLVDISESSYKTWKKSGMMQNGVVYPLWKLVPHTKENGCGLWPTPTRAAASQGSNKPDGKRGQNLISAAKGQLWATPTASEGGYNKSSPNAKKRPTLSTMARKNLWPTPTASCQDMGTLEMSRYSGTERKKGNPKSQYNADNGGSLNPMWVEWLMNFPIGWTKLERLKNEHVKYWKEASSKGISDSCGVRVMWWDSDPSETPYRPEPNEQQKKEHTDIMSEMPLHHTPISKHLGQEKNVKREGMSGLQKEVSAKEAKRQTLQKQRMSENFGETIGRTAVGIKDRVNRLKAIGNGQVPQCAATAWRLLTDER